MFVKELIHLEIHKLRSIVNKLNLSKRWVIFKLKHELLRETSNAP